MKLKISIIGHLTVFEGDCTIGDRVLIHAQVWFGNPAIKH